jgi:hypothetical protein
VIVAAIAVFLMYTVLSFVMSLFLTSGCECGKIDHIDE